MTDDPVRVVLRLRSLGPAGLHPPQTEIINRLQRLTEDGLIDDSISIFGLLKPLLANMTGE